MDNIDIKRVQHRLLEMAKTTAGILDNHNIPYIIAFGTLLGAVRHKGFIPWDDDFDFFLFDDTYSDGMECLAKELPSDMFLENDQTEPNYFHAWAHVKDMNTICECDLYPHDEYYAHKGMNVDLYKMTKIKDKDFADFRYTEAKRYIDRRMELGFISEEDYKRRNQLYLKRRELEENDSEKYVMAYTTDIGKWKYDDVFPIRKFIFENCEFWGPNNAESILQDRYGDWRSLPPEEERKPHHSKIVFLK